jgi:D-galactarolactone cycloisomerase
MSIIERVELWHVAIPMKDPFYPSWIPGYPQTECRLTLMKLTTDDGIEGLTAGNAFETERQGLGSLLGPYLIGLDAEDIPRVRQLLTEASFLGWFNPWVEAACWDIKAKKAGKPVYQLLNPDLPEPVFKAPVYCSTGSLLPVKERLEYMDDIRAMGFTAAKLRVHDFDFEKDVEIIREVRKHVGDDFILGVDANQGWRVTLIDDAPLWDLERAVNFAKACEDHKILWLEEPLEMHEYDALAALRQQTKTKIAGCELNTTWHEAKMFLEKGSYDYYQPDATFCGGLSTVKRIYEECLARDLDFSPHTWSNGLGFLINLHAFCAFPKRHHLEYPYEPPGWIPEHRDGLLAEPIAVNPDGTIDVSQEPGLGLNIDPGKLRKYGKKFFTMTKFRLAVRTIWKKGLHTALELKKKKEARAKN